MRTAERKRDGQPTEVPSQTPTGCPVDLQSDQAVYAWDRDAGVREEVVRAYADRPVWRVDGPSVTGRGFEVAAAP